MSQRFAGRTALLVGDEDARARTIAGQLGDVGVMVEMAPDGYLGLALAERIEAQRGALDLVIVQGSLIGMAAEVFVLRLRDTPFGRRAVVVWLGDGGETAKVDATIAASADPYQVASLAQQLLAQRSPFETLEPLALGRPRRSRPGGGGRQGEPVAAGRGVVAPRLLGLRCQ